MSAEEGNLSTSVSVADTWASNVGLSAISESDIVEVDRNLDTEPRVVPEPPDLAKALNDTPAARAAFDRLPYGLRHKHVAAFEAAKASAVRMRRIAKLVTTMWSDRG